MFAEDSEAFVFIHMLQGSQKSGILVELRNLHSPLHDQIRSVYAPQIRAYRFPN